MSQTPKLARTITEDQWLVVNVEGTDADGKELICTEFLGAGRIDGGFLDIPEEWRLRRISLSIQDIKRAAS